ncbi:hypothetical protein BDA99DRAFT_542711 [Phascolomyces articulosus]|uniref:Uncharacterized protein n=1 Tax=Phascolomyces articulosus TaxID=60185 RepID=A0AAD5K064_9FUNG|nr:hypothetical protein BDA99DRAFT_542711 [Phascolomyces articulosus]
MDVFKNFYDSLSSSISELNKALLLMIYIQTGYIQMGLLEKSKKEYHGIKKSWARGNRMYRMGRYSSPAIGKIKELVKENTRYLLKISQWFMNNNRNRRDRSFLLK